MIDLVTMTGPEHHWRALALLASAQECVIQQLDGQAERLTARAAVHAALAQTAALAVLIARDGDWADPIIAPWLPIAGETRPARGHHVAGAPPVKPLPEL